MALERKTGGLKTESHRVDVSNQDRSDFARGKYYIPGNTLGEGLVSGSLVKAVRLITPHYDKRQM